MERQFALRHSTLYSQDYLLQAQSSPNSLQIMSCPDLDKADSFYYDFNSDSLNHNSNTTLISNENPDTYLVNYDIYGKIILNSSKEDLHDSDEERKSSLRNSSFISSQNIIEEEEEELTEWSEDKENLDSSLISPFEHARRPRAQSESFGILAHTSMLMTIRRKPLKDITPSLKKIKSSQVHQV